jgi:uncharacterized protein (TIGR03086 family)
MLDLGPSTRRMRALVGAVDDDQLEAATPCPGLRLGDLLDHVGTLSAAFAAAARKETGAMSAPPPPPSLANLGPGWRARIAEDLDELAGAWSDPAAWEGSSSAGGITMPSEVTGLVALDELVLHGWDVAVASGQPYEPLPQDVETATRFVEGFQAPRDGNLFGPVVPVREGASPLERLLGLAGRDPAWRPTP